MAVVVVADNIEAVEVVGNIVVVAVDNTVVVGVDNLFLDTEESFGLEGAHLDVNTISKKRSKEVIVSTK